MSELNLDFAEPAEIVEETATVPGLTKADKKAALIERINKGEEVLSYSALSAFAESPKKFIEYKLKDRAQTPAMFYGIVLHCLVLEPEAFQERFFILKDADICAKIGGVKPRSTTAYKEWKIEELTKAEGKTTIDPEVFLTANAAAMAVRSNAPARRLLSKCSKKEEPIEWEYLNFRFRGILDAVEEEKLTLDLKSCADANPRKFERKIVEMDYHLQGAMYLKGKGYKMPYYWIAVDGTGEVSVHLMSDKLLDAGFERYNFLMDRFNDCILMDAWDKSYDFYSKRKDGIYLCDKPSWMY